MVQDHYETEKKSYSVNERTGYKEKEDNESESLFSLICLTIGSILFPDSKTGDASSSLFQRIRNSVSENGPKLREASVRTSNEILQWTQRGSPLRALLVISMGTIVLLTTMALLVFMFFFVAATLNAIMISLMISLAVAGGFLALFFFSLAAIYIGALSIAAFVISTATISAIVSVLFVSGWIGFFYAVWLGTRGSFGLAKQSVSVMGSTILGNSFSRQQQDQEVNIESST